VLNGGRIEQIGAPLEVYHAPASTFVASFIGSPAMNLVKGELHGDRLAIGPAVIALNGFAPASGTVTVGVRAEDIRIARADEEALPFRLEYAEELGAQRLIHGMVGDQQITAAVSPEIELASEMRIAVDASRLHFFAVDTGKRLPGHVPAEAKLAPVEPIV
jgi:sn-glycerol 3-phosphate transport system ATP-binding protein